MPLVAAAGGRGSSRQGIDSGGNVACPLRGGTMAKGEKYNRQRHVITVDVDPKPKAKRRGGPGARRDTLFQAGNPHTWKKGQRGNPSGRAKGTGTKLISEAYTIRLKDSCMLPGLEDLTWAEAIALGMCMTASKGDTSAAREVRETTEGRIPQTMNIGGTIDYAAGKSAKDKVTSDAGQEERERFTNGVNSGCPGPSGHQNAIERPSAGRWYRAPSVALGARVASRAPSAVPIGWPSPP